MITALAGPGDQLTVVGYCSIFSIMHTVIELTGLHHVVVCKNIVISIKY